MTYYVAEIRFNRTKKKRDGRIRKRLTARLITLLLATLLFSASIMIISVAACQTKRTCENRGENEFIIESELRRPLCRVQKPPMILSVLRYPETPNYDEPVTVIAQVVDKQSGVKSVILSYQVDSSGWINTTMSITDGLYTAEIPPQPYNSSVNYKIYAYNWAGKLTISETYSYVVIDSYPPVISYVNRVPASPDYNENVTVFANVTKPPESSGVKNVTLWYRTDGEEWQPVEMTLDQLYTGIIPAFPYGTVVQYRVCAFDYANNWAASGVYSYTVGAPPKLPPVAKFTESAETVYTGEVITFNATSSYDPNGTIISYVWYFGDGTNATGVIVNHAYSDEGKYIVNLTVTDDNGLTGTFISIKTVLSRPPVAYFTENATTVLTRESIHFDASSSYAPDGHIIAYIWNFGDGATASGVSVSHSYEDKGTYNVTLTVIDNYGASSSYSAVKTVLSRPSAGLPLGLLAAIGLGVAALTATLLYALYRRRKKGESATNPGNKVQPKPVVTLYVPAKILSQIEIKPFKLRTN